MIRIINIAAILLALVFAEAATAQRLHDWLKLGDIAMEQNDPYGALRYYSHAMEMDSAKGEVIYKYAEALRANNNYDKAAYYYYQIYRRERGVIYPESGIWLATMQMQAGNYAEAKQNWRRVRTQYQNDKNSFAYKKAVQEMRSCDLAIEWNENQITFELEPLPYPVSSEASEFAGFYSDDSSLIFTSLRGETNAKGEVTDDAADYLPMLYKADSAMKMVEEFQIANISKPVYNYATSADGNTISVATISDAGTSEIRVFDKSTPGQFIRIPQVVDSAWYSQSSFGMVNGKEVLFFASDRKGGFGKEDIWYVTLNPFEPEPINAGKKVNSAGSEITPYYRSDIQKLYFSSDWHHGFGGYDIFESDVVNGNFGYPENLKQPFNTPANDLYYSFNENSKKGTITSNRAGSNAAKGEGCCNDLWVFTEETIKALDTLPEIVSLEDLNAYLPVTLYFHNDEPDPRTRKEETSENYLDTYRSYLHLLPEYQSQYRKGLSENRGDEAEDAMDSFFINEIDQGVEDLEFFTKLLLKELEKGQRIVLTVKGFASPLAATDYNVKLTSRRISSLENYLLAYNHGIFKPYLQSTAENRGSVRFNKIPFGEYVASKMLSANPNESDAIYSIAAAQERKIEITSVQRAPEDTSLAEIDFDSEIKYFGTIISGDSIPFSFDFTYNGDLEIDSLEADSSEITIFDPQYENGSGKISGILHPQRKFGKENLVVLLFGNIAEGSRELNLSFEIE